MNERLYKCLKQGRIGPLSGFKWPTRKWVRAEGKLIPFDTGIHLCREQDIVYWLYDEIWEAECRGDERIDSDSDNQIIVREARLIRKLTTWNNKVARLFAADCAEHVLHFYEEKYPDDDRPRKIIEAARKYAHGKISKNDLEATWEVAREATWVAWEKAGAAWAAWEVADEAAVMVGGMAWETEREWQTKKLLLILDGKLYANKNL